MAQASGAAVDGLLPGEFTHAASGVHYRSRNLRPTGAAPFARCY
jgi:hypothetical protein